MSHLFAIHEHCLWTEYTTTAKSALQTLRPSTAIRGKRRGKRNALFHKKPEPGISKPKPGVSLRNFARLPRSSSEPTAEFALLLDAIVQAQLNVHEEAQLGVTALLSEGATARTFQLHEDLENAGRLQEIVDSLEPARTLERDMLHRPELDTCAFEDADPFDGAEWLDDAESSDDSNSSDDSDDSALDGIDYVVMSEYSETVVDSDEFWDWA